MAYSFRNRRRVYRLRTSDRRQTFGCVVALRPSSRLFTPMVLSVLNFQTAYTPSVLLVMMLTTWTVSRVYGQENLPPSTSIDLGSQAIIPRGEMESVSDPIALRPTTLDAPAMTGATEAGSILKSTSDGPLLGSPNPVRSNPVRPNPVHSSPPTEHARRTTIAVGDPPEPAAGTEHVPIGEGGTADRLPTTIQNLWDADSGTGDDRNAVNDGARELQYQEAPLHLSEPLPSEPLPPAFLPKRAPQKPQDEFLPPSYRPPLHTQYGTLPRAYIPPPAIAAGLTLQWSPWWDGPLGQVSLLSAPTVDVDLGRLMKLALQNSPVTEIANCVATTDCHRSGANVDELLLSVAQNYWEMYRSRAMAIIHERLYQDALEVRDQLRNLVGDSDREMMVLAEARARERLAGLVTTHTELRHAQNRLASVVSISNWEQELEMLPRNRPFNGPYQINEAAELRNALGRRCELQAIMTQIESASFHHQVVQERMMPQMLAAFRIPARECYQAAPIQEQSFASPEIDAVTDQIKLDVKSAVVRIAGSYESMRRFSNASQSAAEDAELLRSRCRSMKESDKDLPLYFRGLLDAQSRLASVEQQFVVAQTSYSAAILELRRANGTIIDQCSYSVGGSVMGPGIPPSASRAIWHQPDLKNPQPAPNENDEADVIFQSPQESLDLPPQKINQHRSSIPWFPETGSVRPSNRQAAPPRSALPVQPYTPPPRSQPRQPNRRYDHSVPKGELPMPRGEKLIPGESDSDVGLFSPTSLQPNELTGPTRITPVVALLQMSQPSRLVWNNHQYAAPSSMQLWQSDANIFVDQMPGSRNLNTPLSGSQIPLNVANPRFDSSTRF